MNLDAVEVVDDFAPFGVRAYTTTRMAGSFGVGTTEPVRDVMDRWDDLRSTIRAAGIQRLATAPQVHGARVIGHGAGWEGWLRATPADGHLCTTPDTAMAVTVADCVPVFLAHPSGATSVLHSGWRGTAARIVEQGIDALAHRGFPPAELRMHLGPGICGKCYEVSPDVVRQLTGETPARPRTVDLRAIIASHARAFGVKHISISASCTRCHNDRFFSHRAGDGGRQISVIHASGGTASA